ncbi:MAG: hypothetical protein ACPGU4_14030 [Flavobacteriales bacterium]
MTFLQVLNMVRDTANAVNADGTFVHGRNSEAATKANKPYPRIHLLPFTQQSDPIETHQVRSNMFLQFHKADTGAQDSKEREEILSEMDTLCNAFVGSITENYSKSVQFVTIRTEPQYQVVEGVSGYSLQLEIQTVKGC